MEKGISLPRIMIAAPSSGSGKTLVTCGILEILQKDYEKFCNTRGSDGDRALPGCGNKTFRPVAFKCGPDYIDPMFHRYVPGVPSRNLDTYFTDSETTCRLMCRDVSGTSDKDNAADTVAVIEGVMGYYDGLGGTSVRGSSFELACKTRTPVILVVDGRGMSLSVLGVIRGFTDPDGITGEEAGDESCQLIKGVILNRVTESVFERIKPLIEERCGVSVIGYVPETETIHFPKRHLGLVMPQEINGLQKQVGNLADILEKTLDMDRLKQIASDAPPVMEYEGPLNGRSEKNGERVKETPGDKKDAGTVRIGIARDEAFCFYYEDNLELLREMGAETVFFSPLHDASLPENLSGLYMGGGYPELHCQELSANISMQRSIAGAVEAGMPCLAECGAFMYLHEEMEDKDGVFRHMAGIVPGRAVKKDRPVNFGYAKLTADEETILGPAGMSVPVHEFHYWDTTNTGGCFTASKEGSQKKRQCMYHYKNLLAGFPHFYFYADPDIAGNFVEACRKFGEERAFWTAKQM